VFELVGECRELGDDHRRWYVHLLAGLARQIWGGVAMGGEFVGARFGPVVAVNPADWGWDNGFNRVGWERGMAEFIKNPRTNRLLSLSRYLARTANSDGMCLARTDLITDRRWDRAWDFQNMVKPGGADHSLFCFRALPGLKDRQVGVIVARALRARDFSAREKAVVQEAMAAVVPLIGGALTRYSEPSPSGLSPRLRQVLRCLLEGDTDKQMAVRLGLTRHTVNQYTKVIFRHFGVMSRAELLARWVRRGWGARFAWAEAPADS
jgi:DNA-binding CsgD family transcriptional regulator